MMGYWHQLGQAFAARTPRERGLIALSMPLLVAVGLMSLWLDPVDLARERMAQQLQSTEAELTHLQQKQRSLTQALAQDPNQAIREHIVSVDRQLASLTQTLATNVGALLSPQQMAQLVEQLMQESHQLRLLSIRSLPPEPIQPLVTASAADTTSADAVPPALYLHPLRIEFTGRYFAIAAYLQQLEKMPQRFYWRSFDYQVSEFPRATVVLQLYTLGQREAFIGG